MAVKHPVGSYHDCFHMDGSAFLTFVLPCVHPDAQQGAHPGPSQVQDLDPGSAR